MAVLPYKDSSDTKKAQIARMFDTISGKYDLLNHLLSAGIDIRWRKKTIAKLHSLQPEVILDIATGTADLAIAACKLNPKKVIGVDISEGMLDIGREKIKRLNYTDTIELKTADSENLPFPPNSFDAVMVAFGVRNFENLDLGLKNMYEVLKPGGMVVILEFSRPSVFPLKQMYNLYLRNLLPCVGKMLSKDKAAYSYLPESVSQFPSGEQFLKILEGEGFKDLSLEPLTFGISTIYTGKK